MAAITASTTAQQLPSDIELLQNLGGVDVYVDTSNAVSSSTGYKVVATTGTLALSYRKRYWIVSASSTSDVRII